MPRQPSAAREVRSIRTSFTRLARSFGRLEALLAAAISPKASSRALGGGPRLRRKPQLSAKQRAALKLQGKYMGTLRGLPARKQARVKRIRKERGIRAAIAEARRLVR
jgi:hypothetical protein